MAFDIETFILDCQDALKSESPIPEIEKILKESLSEPSAVKEVLNPAPQASYSPLYVSDELTILHFIWAPKMTMPLHNHNMWAVVGVYEGREDHIFWRENPDGTLRAAGAASIAAGETLFMGEPAIHSVTNPTSLFTGGIHIYGGNFYQTPRNGWDTLSLEKRILDSETNQAIFERRMTS